MPSNCLLTATPMHDREAVAETIERGRATPAVGVNLAMTDDTLIDRLDAAVRAVASSLGSGSRACTDLVHLRERLRHRRLQVAVVGQFKRGKSTFINALLGAAVLPTGVLPLTAVPTFIFWRETPLIRIHFANGRQSEQIVVSDPDSARSALFHFVTEEANPKNQRGVERVELYYPAATLRGGICLIDTPGIGSTLLHNTEAALRVLPECDVALFIGSADPPITEVELDHLLQVKPKAGRTYFILNKVESLTADEKKSIEGFLRAVLSANSLIEDKVPILPVSARLGLSARQSHDTAAWEKSGMADVERLIVLQLAGEKQPLLQEAVIRRAVEILDQTCGEIGLRMKTLQMPLDELQQKSAVFSSALAQIQAQRASAADLLSGDRRRLVDELEAKTRTLRKTALSRLTDVVDNALSHRDGTWESEAKSSVSAAIEDIFGAAREQLVSEFTHRADTALAGHWHRLEELVSEVRRTAANLFEVKFPGEMEPEGFRLTQEPYWVGERIASRVVPDFDRLLDRFLPTALRRSRRRARILAETNELIVRNAEGLRWAILCGLDETFRAALDQLDERLNEVIAATEDVIRDALARRCDHTSSVQSAVQQLERSSQDAAAARRELLVSGRAERRAP